MTMRTALGLELRDYQERACNEVLHLWHEGVRSVCVVAPTGSGKSQMAAGLAAHCRDASKRVLAFAHRREIVQLLTERLGPEAAAICPGMKPDPEAPIQVATIQTLLASGKRPDADMIIADEAQHFASDQQWATVLESYPNSKIVGFTATPQRADGKPLGNTFQRLVVAAQYSELMDAGHIVDCDVIAPDEPLCDGLAQSPLAAYQAHGGGRRAFLFCRTVDYAYECAEKFCAAQISTAVIEAATPAADRAQHLEMFSSGWLTVLANVYTMTEGIDVPEAAVCILARAPAHASTYLQMVGRVLRPSAGKEKALLIDLTGVSHVFGAPTVDRAYSLDGDAIGLLSGSKSVGSLIVCPRCAFTHASGLDACPRCAWIYERSNAPPRIYNAALRSVYAGRNTEDVHKLREFWRLRNLQQGRGWGLSFVFTEYKKLFDEYPATHLVPESDLYNEYQRYRATGRERGYKPGFAAARYRGAFGSFPPWNWGR